MKSMLINITNTVNLLVVPETREEDSFEFEDGEFDTAKSTEELQLISQKCITDKLYRQKLINHLGTIRGSSCTKVLNKMMHELMDDNVALNYSLKGQREKQRFEDLKFVPLLLSCLKRNPFTRKEKSSFNIDAG
ncbi:unnamed protein product [Allacma fusca]|uniref:DUF4806 domain-containing protein n=1 Tax=Allacma fusca TaxID=39272 RepID=A0A8J2PIT0_9HEXA|nr:unnamed protein product [Allacma fusca]